MRVKPFDPRLLRHAAAARRQIGLVAGIGVLSAALVIAQALVLAEVIVRGMRGDSIGLVLGELAALVVARAILVWVGDVTAQRASAGVKSQLRRSMLRATMQLGPNWLAGRNSGELALLATRGIDALDDYFSRYLPALALAACVPLAVLAAVLTQDLTAAVIVVCTLPLIPLFAALIGIATARKAKRSWIAVSTLAGHFLDVVEGLSTLVAFRRARAQSRTIRRATDDLRRASMGTLRLAFLSSTALELVATVSVALVAVSVGLRLVNGDIDLRPALVVLILAPEAYWPLRRAGAEFHAAADGLAAGEKLFEVIEAADTSRSSNPPAATAARSDRSPITLEVRELSVAGRLPATSFAARPGELIALAGPSGCGKTTLLSVLLGFVAPSSGEVLRNDENLAGLDPALWRSRVAWLPQRPWLTRGTVVSNVEWVAPAATQEGVQRALAEVGLAEFADRELGENGAGLSAGQQQRLALARVLLRCINDPGALVLLDEPTSYLDSDTESVILAVVRRLASTHAVLMVAHRTALLTGADRVVTISPEAPKRQPAPVARRAADDPRAPENDEVVTVA